VIDIGQRTLRLSFDDSIREMYHGYEPVSIRMIDELPGPELGLRIAFASNLPDISHFLIARDEQGFEAVPDGIVTMRLDDSFAAEPRTLRVKVVLTDGTETEPHIVKLSFSPRKPADSQTAPMSNNMVRFEAEPFLHAAPSAMDDWKYPVPTEDEIAFAREKWGESLCGIDGDYAKAKVLAKLLMADLWPNQGRPSPRMAGLPPFEQYKLMVAGQECGFCTNFAAIFECTCKCFDLLVRRIAMAEVPWVSHRLFVHTSPNHCTTELFDGQANQWVLIDLRYFMLGAFLGEEGPLSLFEFFLFLNQPQRRRRLHMFIYDLESREERMLPLAECPRPNMSCYEGWTRFFSYRKI